MSYGLSRSDAEVIAVVMAGRMGGIGRANPTWVLMVSYTGGPS